MNKLFVLFLTFFSGALAFAGGGIIGGGDTNYKALLTCESSGIDPTYPSSPYVWIVKEIDFDGQFIPSSTLRIVTLDDKLNPNQFYVTHDTDLLFSQDNTLSLTMWRYDGGSEGNSEIGSFKWDATSGSGMTFSASAEVEELQLANCTLAPDSPRQ